MVEIRCVREFNFILLESFWWLRASRDPLL
jgi:hypothetical protein